MLLRRYEAVEVPVPNGSTLTRFYFPDLPNLRNARVNAIQLYTIGSISATPNTGSAMVTLADTQKSFLTLYSGDLQLVYNCPILAFNNLDNSANNPFVFMVPDIDGMVITWTKSYISLPSSLTTTNVAYAFGVYYTLPLPTQQ